MSAPSKLTKSERATLIDKLVGDWMFAVRDVHVDELAARLARKGFAGYETLSDAALVRAARRSNVYNIPAAGRVAPPAPVFLLTLADENAGDQHWLFRDRAKALKHVEQDMKRDKERGWFQPDPMTDELGPEVPRESISKSVAWLDAHGTWPYNEAVRWRLAETQFADVPRPQV